MFRINRSTFIVSCLLAILLMTSACSLPTSAQVPTAPIVPTAPKATTAPAATVAPAATTAPTATTAPVVTTAPTATMAPTATAVPTAAAVTTLATVPTAKPTVTPVPTATRAATPTSTPFKIIILPTLKPIHIPISLFPQVTKLTITNTSGVLHAASCTPNKVSEGLNLVYSTNETSPINVTYTVSHYFNGQEKSTLGPFIGSFPNNYLEHFNLPDTWGCGQYGFQVTVTSPNAISGKVNWQVVSP